MALVPPDEYLVTNLPDPFFAIRSFVAGRDKLDRDGCGKSLDETVLVMIGCWLDERLTPFTFTLAEASSPPNLALTR